MCRRMYVSFEPMCEQKHVLPRLPFGRNSASAKLSTKPPRSPDAGAFALKAHGVPLPISKYESLKNMPARRLIVVLILAGLNAVTARIDGQAAPKSTTA